MRDKSTKMAFQLLKNGCVLARYEGSEVVHLRFPDGARIAIKNAVYDKSEVVLEGVCRAGDIFD